MRLDDVWMLLPGRRVGFGTIETQGDEISSVGLREPGKSDRLVLPGLVNCHCHAPMTLLRGSSYFYAAANVALNLLCGFCAVWAGLMLARTLVR